MPVLYLYYENALWGLQPPPHPTTSSSPKIQALSFTRYSEFITTENRIVSLFNYTGTYLSTYLPTYLPLGATALGEPWPPLQPVSTALYSLSSLSMLSNCTGTTIEVIR
jgi:hypothetical protein